MQAVASQLAYPPHLFIPPMDAQALSPAILTPLADLSLNTPQPLSSFGNSETLSPLALIPPSQASHSHHPREPARDRTHNDVSAIKSLSLPSCSSKPKAPMHVVCNAPLVAPVPLPYHSPHFLQFELLPDIDEDLSHPPYTRRNSKRKREEGNEDARRHRPVRWFSSRASGGITISRRSAFLPKIPARNGVCR